MSRPASPTRQRLRRRELIALLSMVMALGALGVDVMLPALGEMRAQFGLAADSNRVAATVTTYILGLAAGTVVFGPAADRFGRKPALFAGFAVYGVGAIGSAVAPSLEALLVSRAVWGFGAAAARTISLSIIRDRFEGDEMAKTMSFVFSIFVLVPIVAPSLGALIIAFASWQWVFWFAAVFALVIAFWTTRLEESLDPANRLSLTPHDLIRAGKQVFGNRQTVGHMLALTASFGVFASYLASSQLIIDDVFDLGDRFPLIFGGLAAVMGVAMLSNARLVDRVGTVRMLRSSLSVYVLVASAFVLLALATGGRPNIWAFLVCMGLLVSMHALLIPNTNSRAMEPMGEIAGTAAAVIGAISTAGGALMGAIIDSRYDGTVTPLAVGFLVSSVAAALLVRWAEGSRRQSSPSPPSPPSPPPST
jgi:DHA1 family bicyclomycin/chloramphenicol resistance-like MFS transporter